MPSDQSAGKDKERGRRSDLKLPDEVIDVACEHRPDESTKGTLML
jgi:hypothetical protein